MSQKRRYWKNNQDFNTYMQYTQVRNQYFHEIKLAKQSSWNDFLENADSEQVYKAYKYCKQRRLEKTSILCYENNQKAASFNEKCDMLLNVLLPANSNNISSVINSAKSSYFAVNNNNLTDFCPADYMSDESK